MDKLSEYKKNTLLLVQTIETDYAYLEWKKNEFNVDIVMKPVAKWLRLIRRIWIRLNFPMQSIWYNSWKFDIARYNTVLIHASAITLGIPKWIKNKYKNIRVILWYWNPVGKKTIPKPDLANYCEIWSFDERNCEKYNMKYNQQYYFKSKILPKNKEINDIFFVGSDKGRAHIVEDIFEFCKKNNILTDFNIVTKNAKNIRNKELVSKYMNYDEILDHISKAKAILEILQNGQSSPTLRTFEALFFSKKLITNNLDIQKFDFYNRNNIFILGKDDLESLSEFISTPYEHVDSKIIDQYDIDTWFYRFFNN